LLTNLAVSLFVLPALAVGLEKPKLHYFDFLLWICCTTNRSNGVYVGMLPVMLSTVANRAFPAVAALGTT